MKYISSKLVYPEQMKKNNKEGTTILTFIINEFGQLKHPTIIKSVTPEFDQAARDCLFNLAQDITWKPGMINGKPINVIYTLPIKIAIRIKPSKLTSNPSKSKLISIPKTRDNPAFLLFCITSPYYDAEKDRRTQDQNQ